MDELTLGEFQEIQDDITLRDFKARQQQRLRGMGG